MSDELRTVRVTAVLTPKQVERLDAYATQHRWSRSTALAALIDQHTDKGVDE